MKKLNLSKFKITHKGLYWGLIITFAILYLCVGFVSTLHSITFFGLANSLGLAILLGLTYEVGQASVLFSILMTKNKDTFLPWALMFLLTALQVTANVYASFKFMATSGSNDWTYWQKSILFGVQAQNAEMYQVIISWIAGALLPIVALGMTALVAQNIRLMTKEDEDKIKDDVDEFIKDKFKTPTSVIDLEKPSDLVDFDETGIGGNPTLEEEKLLSNFINSDKEVSDMLDEEESQMIPQIDTFVNTRFVNQPNKKKAGRPPKQKETVAAPKKEQGLLQQEENVRAPQKEQKNSVDPLIITKENKVTKLLENLKRNQAKETFIEPIISDETSQESPLIPPELRIPYVDSGVEVIDAKAIPKLPEVKKN
jgi:hypothetical protein